MTKNPELWQFVRDRLANSQRVMLLVVAKSSGSSPGRRGYKMAVGSDGQLTGSIGGGVMEVRLVEHAKAILSEPGAIATGFPGSELIEQVHQNNAPNASGMICSGRQSVLLTRLVGDDLETVEAIIDAIQNRERTATLLITKTTFSLQSGNSPTPNDVEGFEYIETLGPKNELIIIGGGHCALALSELMARMDFRIRIFDDRPELSTIEKNRFADEITIIDSYERIGDLIASGDETFVVVMTLGYKFDEIVIRQLAGRHFKYFGVLGSRAKMKTLLTTLKNDGYPADDLARIRTPIGLPINSHSPEEIAVSIAAEIIQVKNA